MEKSWDFRLFFLTEFCCLMKRRMLNMGNTGAGGSSIIVFVEHVPSSKHKSVTSERNFMSVALRITEIYIVGNLNTTQRS